MKPSRCLSSKIVQGSFTIDDSLVCTYTYNKIKFGYSEKATKFEKNLSGRFFLILWPSQNIRTLTTTQIKFPAKISHQMMTNLTPIVSKAKIKWYRPKKVKKQH